MHTYYKVRVKCTVLLITIKGFFEILAKDVLLHLSHLVLLGVQRDLALSGWQTTMYLSTVIETVK